MIPSLPVEILIKILHLATSPSYAISVRRDDRRLLRQCSLVSKQFCAVAQPKLWSVFTAQKGGNLEPLHKFPQQAQHIRMLEYEGPHRMDCLVNAAKTLPSLVEVRVIEGILTKANLGAFRYITHLTFVKVHIASFSSIVLRNLVSLAIDSIQPTRHTKNPLFPAASVPSLRAVCVQGVVSQRNTSPGLAHLPLDQLDVLQVNIKDYSAFPPALYHQVPAVLLTLPVERIAWMETAPDLLKFEHLLLECAAWNTPDSWHAHLLSRLVHIIESREKPFQSLSLPTSLSVPTPLYPKLASARDTLLAVCKTLSVDIIWRPYAQTWQDDVGVSRDFWQYAKELKSKKAVEAEPGTKASETT